MNDREIFRENLNYYLSISGKLQKDLADYVGAKTTTVSGWTRGVSYPRADAMEKIAMFFGVPTSKLVGSRDNPPEDQYTVTLKTKEARSFAIGIDKMPPTQREAIMHLLDGLCPGLFEKGNENDDA